MSDDLEIFIPTRDGLAFLLPLAEEFHRLGLAPRYFIDGGAEPSFRAEALKRLRGAEALSTNARHFADLLPEIVAKSRARWLFRFDDDEAPTEALARWLPEAVKMPGKMALAVPRRTVRYVDDQLVYARNIPNLHPLDIQFRGFIPAATTLRLAVHMPNFHMRHPDDVAFAPDDCGLYHFDWILRDRAFRAKKLLRYEFLEPGSGENFKFQYLPEDFNASVYDFAPVSDPAIIALAGRLRAATQQDGGAGQNFDKA